jgi:RNA polymerase sigma factor (sigma-70 family)
VDRLTDQQLLRDYAGQRDEAAFAELVRRHVDLVYSAALRMVRDAHLAEDVTQGVFAALAQNASQLADRAVLAGWLHRTAQNIAANLVRSEVRRRAREQEAVAMNELLTAETDAPWESIAPHLDAALGELEETDRDALLLRYFQRLSAQEMAGPLGITAEAAQKRVSRAVVRLRELFATRGVTVGAGGLVVVISANAVQAAPGGLASSISATAVTAAAVKSSTAITTAKIIAMTTLQKTVVALGLTAILATVAVVSVHEVSVHRDSASQSASYTSSANPKWGQTVLCGGFKVSGGHRLYFFVTPKRETNLSQLTVDVEVVESDKALGLTVPEPAQLTGILNPDQHDLSIKSLSQAGFPPEHMQMRLLDGQKSQIRMSSSKYSVSMGLQPTISADGESVSLELNPAVNLAASR